MNKYKKTIKKALEGEGNAPDKMCAAWREWIKGRHPELFKEEFKVGDWVVGWHHEQNPNHLDRKPWRIASVDYEGGKYYTPEGQPAWNCQARHIRKATKEEIETHLIQEAKRRRFVEGAKFASLQSDGTPFEQDVSKVESPLVYDPDDDSLDNEVGDRIYCKGQWAEILNPIPKTLQKAIDELGTDKIKELLEKAH